MKAIGLVSGGLDSILAVKAIMEQGIEVIPVHFLMPFVKYNIDTVNNCSAKKLCDQLGVPLRVVHLTEEYFNMLKDPEHGYGKNLNPCIDCKILFLRKAKEMLDTEGASFVFTGEVIGQRPMSQKKWALHEIEKKAGLEGLLVRPLSALCMDETIPQKEGWLKKEKLFAFNGRTRTPQIELAAKWGIVDFPAPAGGCLLTEREFCSRLKDIIDHENLTVRECEFLKVGRYFRLSEDFTLSVGRDKAQNDALTKLAGPNDFVFKSSDLPGPTAVGRGVLTEEIKQLCAKIIARYTAPKADSVEIKFRHLDEEEIFQSKLISDEQLENLRF